MLKLLRNLKLCRPNLVLNNFKNEHDSIETPRHDLIVLSQHNLIEMTQQYLLSLTRQDLIK